MSTWSQVVSLAVGKGVPIRRGRGRGRGRGRENLKGVVDKNMAHLKVAWTADLPFRNVDLALRADFPHILRASSYWAEGWSPPEPPL